MKKQKGHLIKSVDPGSIAEELELEPGDRLLTINGNEVEDIFDYEYYVDSESMVMLVEKADGEQWELEIENEYQDLGITFENGLMSDYKSCSNKCIFCFIDQMPPGMRETLYFKDDDSRLSFLQGTNMKNMTSSVSLILSWRRSTCFRCTPPIRSCAADAPQPLCGRSIKKDRPSL